MILGLSIALGIILFDQASKFFIFNNVLGQYDIIQVTPFFNLVKAWNTGVSFSMFNDYGVYGRIGLVIVALLIVGALVLWLKSEKSKFMQIALGFVIGGAIGNVIDRIRLGAVFDFLDFYIGTSHWPAFNVADSFICIGAVMLIFKEIFLREKSK
ncbi:MAG: signal peptidase II [Alphaproteobacteria bacterium]